MLLGLIRPTRGGARSSASTLRTRAGRHARADRLPARRPRALRADDAASSCSPTSPGCAAVSTRGVRALAERLAARPRPPGRRPLARQPAEGRCGAGVHARPRLLILDEPTSGLDPLVQQEFQRARPRGRRLRRHGVPVLARAGRGRAARRPGRRSSTTAGSSSSTRSTGCVSGGHASASSSTSPSRPRRSWPSRPGVRAMEVRGDTAVCTVAGPVGPLLAVAVATGWSTCTRTTPISRTRSSATWTGGTR